MNDGDNIILSIVKLSEGDTNGVLNALINYGMSTK